jgi:predicted phosphodiesterase
MRKKLVILALLTLLLAALIYIFTPVFFLHNYPVPISRVINKNFQNKDRKIVFVSDTQTPIWIETILLDRNNNELATHKIFKKIQSEKPSAVFHLGDLVAFGFNENDWQPIDDFIARLKTEGTYFFPVLGNHEVLFFTKFGEYKFQKRFPDHSITGYAVAINSIGVLLLNSNFNVLSETERNQQHIFLRETIETFENDSTISVIIVCCHHSPYTNGRIEGPDENVQNNFVPNFLKSKKCKMFISGHSHGFEHFKLNGKDFLVIGGGGGLQHPHDVGQEAKWYDYYSNSLIKRNFHFVTCEIIRDMLVFKLYMLDDAFKDFIIDYSIEIPL